VTFPNCFSDDIISFYIRYYLIIIIKGELTFRIFFPNFDKKIKGNKEHLQRSVIFLMVFIYDCMLKTENNKVLNYSH